MAVAIEEANNASSSGLTYAEKRAMRRANIQKSILAASKASSYEFDPLLTLPHGNASVNAACIVANNLYTGSSDGFIRKWDLVASGRGRFAGNNYLQQPTGDNTPSNSPIPFPVLAGYWENSEPQAAHLSTQSEPRDRFNRTRFGPRNANEATTEAGGFAVHSLAVQDEELWSLAGSENGNVNLFSVRIDEGQCRHVFRASPDPKKGHLAKNAVSALQIGKNGTSFVSGGWDKRIFEWSLDTGDVSHTFEGATNQITSLAFRPTPGTPASKDGLARESSYDPLFDEDAEGEADDAPKTAALPFPDAMDSSNTPLSSDVLLATCIDGNAMLWDRRAKQMPIRSLPLGKGAPPWALQATWSPDGNQVYIGRRNATIDLYDLKNSITRTLRLPSNAGPVNSIRPLPNGRHLLCGSTNIVRLWDLQAEGTKKVPWTIVPANHTGPLADLQIDEQARILVQVFGDRGFLNANNYGDGVAVHAVRTLDELASE